MDKELISNGIRLRCRFNAKMSFDDSITGPFSERRKLMVTDFGNVTGSHDAQRISAKWSEYYHDFAGARGIFVVDDPKHDLLLPGDHDFGGTGFLRCLMGSTRLLNIQNSQTAREFRYSAPIFCDTNFVSYCGAFFAGRGLGQNADGFRKAVTFLLRMVKNLNATPYVMENAEKSDTDKIRESLIGFAAFTRTPIEHFKRHDAFIKTGKDELERMADVSLDAMRGSDFRRVHRMVKDLYIWARVILLKSTIIAFTSKAGAVESRMRELYRFMHDELARIQQFGIFVAFRFFSLNEKEPFFSSVQQNASALDRTLDSMAWDLAHWTALFDLTMIHSSHLQNTAFPVPHFLSFDRRFIRLTETFKLDGVIYAAKGKRCEQFYSRPLLRAVSNLLAGPLGEFNTSEAIANRRQRIAENESQFDERLLALEADLSRQLMELCKHRL